MDPVTVLYEDPSKQKYKRVFYDNPNKKPGFALIKAREFVRELKRKNEISPHPVFKNIEIKF